MLTPVFEPPRSILVIGGEQHDLLAQYGAAEVGNRHVGAFDRALAGGIRIDSRQIVDVADDYLIAGSRQRCDRQAEERTECGNR